MFFSNEEHRGPNVTPKCNTQNHSENPKPATTTKYYNLIIITMNIFVESNEYDRNERSTGHSNYNNKD